MFCSSELISLAFGTFEHGLSYEPGLDLRGFSENVQKGGQRSKSEVVGGTSNKFFRSRRSFFLFFLPKHGLLNASD